MVADLLCLNPNWFSKRLSLQCEYIRLKIILSNSFETQHKTYGSIGVDIGFTSLFIYWGDWTYVPEFRENSFIQDCLDQ